MSYSVANISENWGSLDAIEYYNKNLGFQYDLVIIGKCPDEIEYEKLIKKVSQSAYKNKIKLIGIKQYVAHHEILEWTSNASFLFCLYPNNPAIQNRIPTKMMEAWCFKTPIIFSPIDQWKSLNEKYHFGFSTEEENNISDSFYDQNIPESEYLWQKMYEYYEIWFKKQF